MNKGHYTGTAVTGESGYGSGGAARLSNVDSPQAARYNSIMQGTNGFSNLIVQTPGTCGGRARINGRRIPVSSVYRWFLSGLSPEDILTKYESVTLAQVYAAIAYALANREEITAEIAHEDELSAAAPSGETTTSPVAP